MLLKGIPSEAQFANAFMAFQASMNTFVFFKKVKIDFLRNLNALKVFQNYHKVFIKKFNVKLSKSF